MKHTITLGLCAPLLLSATAWSAPKAQPAGMDEIRVENNYSYGVDHGGDVGSSETWVIRANDTAVHDRNFSVLEASPPIEGDVGLLPKGSYARMLEYLQWTRLLDPKNAVQDGELSVSLKRGGKVKRATVAGSAAYWTTNTVVRNLVQGVVWKTPAQFKAGTGLAVLYQIDDTLQGAELEAAKAYPRPIYSVLNAAGKEVATMKPNTDKQREAFLSPAPVFQEDYQSAKDVSSFFTLAPGTYGFKLKSLDGTAPASPTQFEWRVIGDVTDDLKFATANVVPGRFNFIVIRVVKKGTPPI